MLPQQRGRRRYLATDSKAHLLIDLFGDRGILKKLQTAISNIRLVLVLLALLLTAGAPIAQAEVQSDCAVKALMDYNRASLEIRLKAESPVPVDATIALRRLEEQYCLRLAHRKANEPMVVKLNFRNVSTTRRRNA
jgi:hypothetical protein